jgi:bifunctional non-homologous end joining protein LigD
MADKEIRAGSHSVKVSRPEKVLFPDDNYTKEDLVDYYQRIAEVMLPHMEGRPITMHRFPNGITESAFYQKQAPDYFPEWITRVLVEVEEEGEKQPQIVVDNPATLVYLADQACITPHIWLSRVDRLYYPDKMIFDLDPPDNKFELVRDAAKTLRGLLEELGLVPFVMTTGSRGLHVVVPLDRSADFDMARAFARDVAEVVANREPERYTIEIRKSERDGRLFLDYLRNSYAQHGAAPYAVRAYPGAPIATPLDWDEVAGLDHGSQTYTLKNIFRRVGQKGDPWTRMMSQARSLEAPRRRLDALRSDA